MTSMGNDLIKKGAGLPTTPQQAEKIYNVDNIQNFHHTSQFFMMTGLPGMPGAEPTPISYFRDYYNLIVYGQDPMLTDCHITLERGRCLQEPGYITPELMERFAPLTPPIIDELKGFLCILASENKYYGWTDEDHYASVAQLTDIKIRTNGIELYLHPLFAVPQEKIRELVFELGISGWYHKYNELNHSHWTIKEIDLIEVLGDAGLNPFVR